MGTWAITGHGFFWPFFPIMGWGIGLGMHAAAEVTKKGKCEDDTAPSAALSPPVPSPSVPIRQVASPSVTPYVAVLFVDVANSSGLTEALGDDDWRNVRARHLELVRACISEHGGTEVSCQGDGVFVRFDSPAHAASCAVAMQRGIDHRKQTAGFSPSVRIGIHAGKVVTDGDDLLGAVVNLAARVTAESQPNQILITEPVAESLTSDFTVEDAGVRPLKGIALPRHLLSLSW